MNQGKHSCSCRTYPEEEEEAVLDALEDNPEAGSVVDVVEMYSPPRTTPVAKNGARIGTDIGETDWRRRRITCASLWMCTGNKSITDVGFCMKTPWERPLGSWKRSKSCRATVADQCQYGLKTVTSTTSLCIRRSPEVKQCPSDLEHPN